MNKDIRRKVYQKYNGHCAYCGKEILLDEMQVDHIIPKHYFGANELDNYNPSCRQCNFYKGTFSIDVFRKNLLTLHERIMKPFISRLGLDYGIIEIKPFDGKFYFETQETNLSQGA